MGRPLTLALDIPKPKISWNGVRGVLSTATQKLVRPVSVRRPSTPSPRVSHEVMALAAITPPTAVTAAVATKNRRTRALLRLSPATATPAMSPISPVLVCDSSSSAIPIATPARAARPLALRPIQRTVIIPAATAPYCASCVG
jgi:hypothetical protein